MAMFTHVALGTNDLNKARQFYDAVLAPLGYKRIKDLGDRGSCWGQSAEEFIVLTPADGKPACPANGGGSYSSNSKFLIPHSSFLIPCSFPNHTSVSVPSQNRHALYPVAYLPRTCHVGTYHFQCKPLEKKKQYLPQTCYNKK